MAAMACILIGLSAAPARAQTPAVKSLCKPDEKVIFACPTAGKIVSLCLSPAGPVPGTLHYRFGRPGAVELAYPKTAAAPTEAFTAGRFRYIAGSNSWLRFVNSGVRYTVFSAAGRWGAHRTIISVAGVAVDQNGKRIANLPCAGDPTDELGSDLFTRLGFKVDEDAEDAVEQAIDPSPFIPR